MRQTTNSQFEDMKQDLIKAGCSPAIIQRLNAMQRTTQQQYPNAVPADPWLGIDFTHIGLTLPANHPVQPLCKSDFTLGVKADYILHNCGAAPAFRVAASFFPGGDSGGERYPHGYACAKAEERSRDRLLAAPAIFPQQDLSIEGEMISGASAQRQLEVIVGCIVYQGPPPTNKEMHTQVVLQFTPTAIPDGFAPTAFEASHLHIRYVEVY